MEPLCPVCHPARMRSNLYIWILLIAAPIMAQAQSSIMSTSNITNNTTSTSTTTTTSTTLPPAVSLAGDVLPIFAARCTALGCHVEEVDVKWGDPTAMEHCLFASGYAATNGHLLDDALIARLQQGTAGNDSIRGTAGSEGDGRGARRSRADRARAARTPRHAPCAGQAARPARPLPSRRRRALFDTRCELEKYYPKTLARSRRRALDRASK